MSVDFSHFNLNSDYETDDVILCSEKSLTLNSGIWTGTITHNFGFKALPFAMFEINGDGLWLNASETDSTDAYSLSAISYNNRIDVSVRVPSGVSATSVKARVFALFPSDIDVSVVPPTTFGTFMLNSEYKYDELLAKGTANITNYTSGSQTIYTHNLGYIPRAMLWQETIGGDSLKLLDPMDVTMTTTGLPTTEKIKAAQLSTTEIAMWYYSKTSTYPDLKIHYRVYASKLKQEGF